MKEHTILEDLGSHTIVFDGMAEVSHTPKGGVIVSMDDGRLVWKLLKEGIIISSEVDGNVQMVLRRSAPSKAMVRLSGYTMELPVRLIRMEAGENTWNVEYEIEDSKEVFAFSLKIFQPLETKEEIG